MNIEACMYIRYLILMVLQREKNMFLLHFNTSSHTLATRRYGKIVLKYRVRIDVGEHTIKRIETEHNH